MENDNAFPKWKLILSILAISSLPIILTSTPFYIVDFSNKGQVGDTIGGIMGPFIGILASVLTYMAFMVQFNANKQQREDIELERVRSNFFEMISFYRMNVEELKYKSLEKEEYFYGRKVFYVVYKQMLQILKEIDLFYKDATVASIFTKEFIDSYTNTEMSSRNRIDLIELAKINHAYLILFYGVHDDGRKAIEQFLEGNYNESFYKDVNKYMSLKPIKNSNYWNEYEKLLNTGYDSNYIKKCCKYP